MTRTLIQALLICAISFPGVAAADELTQIVQQDLAKLGYQIDRQDGEASTLTTIQVMRFQRENGLAEDGKITMGLASRIKSALKDKGATAESGAAVAVTAPAASGAASLPSTKGQ